MKSTPERIINRIFGSRSSAAVEAIVQSAPVVDLLAQIDGAEVARRAALVKQLQELPAKHEKQCIAANKEVDKAKQALEAAQEAVKKAAQAHSEAYMLAISRSCSLDCERSALERELERSADSRIWLFIGHMHDLFGKARHFPPAMVMQAGGLKFSHYDNSVCRKACEALNAARDAAKALIWQALTTDQVTSALERLCADLVAPLAAVSLRPPQIEGEQAFAIIH